MVWLAIHGGKLLAEFLLCGLVTDSGINDNHSHLHSQLGMALEQGSEFIAPQGICDRGVAAASNRSKTSLFALGIVNYQV